MSMRTPQRLHSLLALVLLVSSCGGTDYIPGVGYDARAPQDSAEQVILSENYAGYLVLHLEEGLGARLSSTKELFSTKGQPDPLISIEGLINSYSTVSLRQSVNVDADRLDALKAKLERVSGGQLADFNSIFKIDAPDTADAVLVYRELKDKDGVRLLYPAQKTSPTGIIDVPDLTVHQGYLYPEATHGGLNPQAAWSAGITGAGVRVIDVEGGWNHQHEDLNIHESTAPCPITSTDPECHEAIAHGTSVAGILGSLHNGHGTDGFAPDADFHLNGIYSTAVVDDAIMNYLDGDDTDGEMYPGDIMMIEVQMRGAIGDEMVSCDADPHGCIPTTTSPSNYAAVEYAIAAGITVIEGAGNGYVDLDDSATYNPSPWINLSIQDVGSIVGGASQGAGKVLHPYSNWGSRVDVFAWGNGVATAGYPYTGNPYVWSGTTSPVPPNTETNAYYTDMFGGTSAAAAMIAGSAVLVQSYAKQELVNVATRFIMPLKMREILADSGVAQSGSGGNIGMQPRIDEAMNIVDTFVADVFASYPELVADEQLTETQYLALRAMGVGLVCGAADIEHHMIIGVNDPSCPEVELWPEGNYIGEHYDFDGDGRADLVQFSNGNWKIDLSGTGSAADGFGAWDVDVAYTAIDGDCGVWPYVEDMNSDGRADFVAYDKCAGVFYVSLTDTDLTRNNVWHGWDWVIDYSSQWHDQMTIDPADADYSRPFIAQYNNDAYLDIGIACSDGFVRVDYGDGTEAGLGSFEWSSQLLTDTMLAQAPGWAYLLSPGDFELNGTQYFSIKVPDTHPDEGRMYIIPHDGVDYLPDQDWMEMLGAPYIFGGSDHVSLVADYEGGEYPNLSVKNGDWLVTDDGYYNSLFTLAPTNIYGGPECHPVVGRFDGDNKDDRAVMCPDQWKIAYSSDEYDSLLDTDGARHVSLGYDPCEHSLPGRSYSGGISYAYAQQLMNFYQAQHPGDPVPILVDMVTIVSCED
ncbi:MAG: S8 family serine peptidase [bacterium]